MNLAVMNAIYALGANVSGFIAQLVTASHRYRKVTGLNLVEILKCPGLYIRSCINCVHNYEDHSLLDSHPQFYILNISYNTSHYQMSSSGNPLRFL